MLDCKDCMMSVDSLKVPRCYAGLNVAQEQGCPGMGMSVMIVEG